MKRLNHILSIVLVFALLMPACALTGIERSSPRSQSTVGIAVTPRNLIRSPAGKPTPQPYLYTGEQFDPDLGFYYLRARYSNPDSGRFWTMDSYEGDEEEPLSLHKYIFCSANPINRIDPSGYAGVDSMQGNYFEYDSSISLPSAALVARHLRGLTSGEAHIVVAAQAEAKKYADEALLFLLTVSANNIPSRYVRWFGSYDSKRMNKVTDSWCKIRNALYNDTISYAARKYGYGFHYSMDYYGWSIRWTKNRYPIRLGDLFWTASRTGMDSQAGTIIHELSHMYAGTIDKTYGAVDSEELATNDPNKAVKNADNYEYFVELK